MNIAGKITGTFLILLVVIFFTAFTRTSNQDYDVDILLNKPFTITLGTNPSTGYRWYWEKGDASLFVDSLSRTYISDRPARPGTGGEDRWTFKGIRKGSCVLRFVRKRPGGAQVPAQSKVFRVRVR